MRVQDGEERRERERSGNSSEEQRKIPTAPLVQLYEKGREKATLGKARETGFNENKKKKVEEIFRVEVDKIRDFF